MPHKKGGCDAAKKFNLCLYNNWCKNCSILYKLHSYVVCLHLFSIWF